MNMKIFFFLVRKIEYLLYKQRKNSILFSYDSEAKYILTPTYILKRILVYFLFQKSHGVTKNKIKKQDKIFH